MQSLSKHPTQTVANTAPANERVVLLDEVHFKWLLSGLGLWIDLTRFRTEPDYAAHFLALAQVSDSRALRERAQALMNQDTLTDR